MQTQTAEPFVGFELPAPHGSHLPCPAELKAYPARQPHVACPGSVLAAVKENGPDGHVTQTDAPAVEKVPTAQGEQVAAPAAANVPAAQDTHAPGLPVVPALQAAGTTLVETVGDTAGDGEGAREAVPEGAAAGCCGASTRPRSSMFASAV